MEKDNGNQTLIKEQWIHSLVEVVIEGPKVDILEKRRQIASRGRFSIKERKGIYTKE